MITKEAQTMNASWSRALSAGILFLALISPTRGADKPPPAEKVLSPLELAARIDFHIQAKWAKLKVVPAKQADDAEFLRRASLDIIGRIPTVTEIHDFLDDKSPDKRARLVSRMLETYGYIGNFTAIYRDLIVPQGGNNQFAQAFGQQMEAWLTAKLKANAGYDALVRDLLTADPLGGLGRIRGGRAQPVDPNTRSVIAFYQANELKPDNVASAVSRVFLGIKLECAQCHDHPFNHYSREQFWQTAAFFGGLKPNRQDGMRFQQASFDPAIREIKIPNTERVAKAKFLDNKEPTFPDGADARSVLADWITAPENPYFARAAVNYLWAHFFGLGIIDPVDEPSEENPPSHPELLQELSRQFVLNKYDIKYMIKAMTASQAYQLTSAQSHPSQANPRVFGAMQLKGLSPEQLLDSLNMAVGNMNGTTLQFQPGFAGRRAFNQMSFELRNKFANYADKRTEYQTSILQALALMNGKMTADATSLTRGGTLAAIADSPFMDTESKLNALYLASLSRKMRPEEASKFVRYVESGGPSKDQSKALADIYWALLNSSEFILNH
jgi:hypothetical protein